MSLEHSDQWTVQVLACRHVRVGHGAQCVAKRTLRLVVPALCTVEGVPVLSQAEVQVLLEEEKGKISKITLVL